MEIFAFIEETHSINPANREYGAPIPKIKELTDLSCNQTETFAPTHLLILLMVMEYGADIPKDTEAEPMVR